MSRRVRTPEGAKKYGVPIGTPLGAAKAKAKADRAGKRMTSSEAKRFKMQQDIRTQGIGDGKPQAPTPSKHERTITDSQLKAKKKAWRDSRGKRPTVSQSMDRIRAAEEAASDKPDANISASMRRLRNGYPAKKTTGSGTKDDPVKTSNIDDAVEAIKAGKYVELSRPDEVATLIDKLAKVAQDFAAQGDNAKGKFDLCKVSVPNTNLFCAQSKIPDRSGMPQLKGKPEPGSKADKLPKNKDGEADLGPAYIDSLKKKGVKVRSTKIDASHLKASQGQLDGATVAGMVNNEAFDPGKEPIFVTSDGYVIDGHHRWAAQVGRGYKKGQKLEMNVTEIDMPIIDVLRSANEFTRSMGVGARGLGKAAPPCIGCNDKRTLRDLLFKRDGKNDKAPNPKSTPKEIVGSHGHRPHGKSILWPAMYEHLRRKGMTKEKAARISNAAWNKKRAGLKTNTPTSARGLAKMDTRNELRESLLKVDPVRSAAAKKAWLKRKRATPRKAAPGKRGGAMKKPGFTDPKEAKDIATLQGRARYVYSGARKAGYTHLGAFELASGKRKYANGPHFPEMSAKWHEKREAAEKAKRGKKVASKRMR